MMRKFYKSWHRKSFSKFESANFDKSKDRYNILKKNSSSIYPCLELYENDKCWTTSQEILYKAKKNLFFSEKQLKILSKQLDKNSKVGIFHGDLCFSNIDFDKDGNVLIYDWEINLEVLKNKHHYLRTTSYCIHPADKKNNQITEMTDKFGIFALTMISCHSPSWRSALTHNNSLRQRVANYIDNIEDFSYTKLVDQITERIKSPQLIV